jgi:hypothetical protein
MKSEIDATKNGNNVAEHNQRSARDPHDESSISSKEHHGPNASSDGRNISKENKDWLEYATAGFALIAALGSISAAAVGYWQWGVMNGQLTQMQESSQQTEALIAAARVQADSSKRQAETGVRALVVTQRAWIAPLGMVISPDTPLGKSDSIRMEILYSNVGREPALNVNLSATEAGFTAPPQEWMTGEWSKFFTGDNNRCSGANPIAGAPTIYPTLSAFSPNMSLRLTINDKQALDKIASVNEVLFIRGCMVYETVQEIHRSAYCFYLQPVFGIPPEKWTTRSCPDGNKAD